MALVGGLIVAAGCAAWVTWAATGRIRCYAASARPRKRARFDAGMLLRLPADVLVALAFGIGGAAVIGGLTMNPVAAILGGLETALIPRNVRLVAGILAETKKLKELAAAVGTVGDALSKPQPNVRQAVSQLAEAGTAPWILNGTKDALARSWRTPLGDSLDAWAEKTKRQDAVLFARLIRVAEETTNAAAEGLSRFSEMLRRRAVTLADLHGRFFLYYVAFGVVLAVPLVAYPVLIAAFPYVREWFWGTFGGRLAGGILWDGDLGMVWLLLAMLKPQ